MLKKIPALSIINIFMLSAFGMFLIASTPTITRVSRIDTRTYTRYEFVSSYQETGFVDSRYIEDVYARDNILSADEFFTQHAGSEFSVTWVVAGMFNGTTPFGGGQFGRIYEFVITDTAHSNVPMASSAQAQPLQDIHQSQQATPSNVTVLINGQPTAFHAYNIQGNNFFMLRDLAYSLNGTDSSFNVGWSATNNAISLTSNQTYTIVGGEMVIRTSSTRVAAPTTSRIELDGSMVTPRGYLIGDNNFFMLRELGELIGFAVDWNSQTSTILINTGNAPQTQELEHLSTQRQTEYSNEPQANEFSSVQSTFEQALLVLVNNVRAEHGLSALVFDNGLARAARSHSEDLATNNIFSHIGSDGSTYRDRAEREGTSFTRVTENVHRGRGTPEGVVESWMNSPSHRAHILNDSFTHAGIGFALCEIGRPYSTLKLAHN